MFHLVCGLHYPVLQIQQFPGTTIKLSHDQQLKDLVQKMTYLYFL